MPRQSRLLKAEQELRDFLNDGKQTPLLEAHEKLLVERIHLNNSALSTCQQERIRLNAQLESVQRVLEQGKPLESAAPIAKSNAVYKALGAARKAVASGGSEGVPEHLRNAPTRLSKQLGHGQGYQYDHDFPDGVAYNQQCLPESVAGRVFYQPVDRGLEASIRERLDYIRRRRSEARR